MDTTTIQGLIRETARFGTVITTSHCRQRMVERSAQMDDMLNVLLWGNVYDLEEQPEQNEWKCKMDGEDLDGDKLTLIVAVVVHQHVLIVTVY
jgi:Domain of unknown function (DUF4258)